MRKKGKLQRGYQCHLRESGLAMSRKPPKLIPIEGKATTAQEKKELESMPPLKHGSSVNVNSAGNTSVRSTPTRNFLNCNGTTANTRRRFASRISTSSIAAPLRPSTSSPPDSGTTSNGCGAGVEQIPIPTSNKVNGTISNGISTKASEPTKQQVRRQKSLAVDGEESSSSDSQQNNSSITFTNGGRKAGSTNSRNNVSDISQNVNIVNTTKRTSRFSQNSNVLSNKILPKEDSAPSSPSGEDMPALVAYDNSTERKEPPLADNSVEEPALDNQTVTESTLEEPKIIRKGDTVIKSYVDEKTGRISIFEKDMKLEVCDFGSGKWYPAKVKLINEEDQTILVHYSNWSSRYDEWIQMNSNRVRPSESTNVISQRFSVGEKVEAYWSLDSKKYLGTITQILQPDMYEVKFYDGIKVKRSANQLFKVSQMEASQSKIETHTKEPDELISQTEEVKETPPVKVGKRRSLKTNAIKVVTKAPETVQDSNSLPEPSPESALLSPGSRPAHFSVFDPPSGELGKRKRTVHDYSVLVKGRTPTSRGPRRPKSEDAITITPSSSVTSITSTAADDDFDVPPTQVDSPSESFHEHVVSPTGSPLPSTRRRKSGTATNVPTVKPSADSPKELPVIEEQVIETSPPPNPSEIPTKKRKHLSIASATPSDSVTVENRNNSVKIETSQISAESIIPTNTSPNASATITTKSRRAKSLGNTPLANIPPSVHTDVPKDNDTRVDSGFADESGKPIIIEVNPDDGFWKCPLNNCRKNFRKDSLLKMHLKHYHPELKVTRGNLNVVQMAQARTAFENEHPSDHHTWQKISSFDQSSGTDTHNANISVTCSTDDLKVIANKSASASKENSPDKVSPTPSHKSESEHSKSISISEESISAQNSSKALNRSSRLRLNRGRTFMVKRIRANNRHVTNNVASHVKRKVFTGNGSARTAIATDGSSVSKKLKLAESDGTSEISISDLTSDHAATNSLQSPCKTLSPSKSDKKSEHFFPENCSRSSGSDPYLHSTSPESENLISEGSGPHRGRWNKSQIRRNLINQNRRRVGSSILPNSTSIFLKKRMQMRKLIGKRTRQKRTSILSRISSGRMRVILEALNQRSLKHKRFRASRRFRDVKVDVINCICNNKTEFGLMIQCELCLCWQHGSCFNVQSNSQLPEYYACQSCSEPERVRLSKKYEWAESEFYKLGKLPSFPFAPSFPKGDTRTMKACTNLTSNLLEVYAMIKGLKLQERICFGHPEHPKLYQWNTERVSPQEEIQKDRFIKYFQPVLRKLLLENKSDGQYIQKLKKLAETRNKLKKYSEAVESARLTMKKKLGCRAAAYVTYMCDNLLDDMVKIKRKRSNEECTRKETLEGRRRHNAEQAYHRLQKLRDELLQNQCKDQINVGKYENRFPSLENGIGTVVSASSFMSSSPSTVKNELHPFSNNLTRSSPQKYVNNVSLSFGTKSAIPSTSNGLKKDIAASVRDVCLLRKYLKERRSTDNNVRSTLERISKQFPEEWKNLMKLAGEFVDETSKDTIQDEKFKWVLNVVITYNSLRILLRQIYSESNTQKQRNFCSEFEKATIHLFDLFGIGLTEERKESKSSTGRTSKRIKGLETLQILEESTSAASDLLKAVASASQSETSDEAKTELLTKLATSDEPLTSADMDGILPTATETKIEEDMEVCNSSSSPPTVVVENKSSPTNNSDCNNSVPVHQSSRAPLFARYRRLDGYLTSEFSDKVQLGEAVTIAAGISLEEATEENVTMNFPVENTEIIKSASYSGIIPVPATSRITPEVCKKNLVRDILMQQHQIDLYLDRVEAHILKLSSQSRQRSTVSSMKPMEMSVQRDRMLHSLELVSRLTKTLIGENDIVERTNFEDADVSETAMTDFSEMDSSSESDDGDNTSNYSGTDTETADEGDNSGDDLLDI